MRPGSRSGAAILDPPAQIVGDGPAPVGDPAPVTYHVLLLAGEPRRHTCVLPAGIEAGTDVEIAGEQWTVADVRESGQGASATLVCIYAT